MINLGNIFSNIGSMSSIDNFTMVEIATTRFAIDAVKRNFIKKDFWKKPLEERQAMMAAFWGELITKANMRTTLEFRVPQRKAEGILDVISHYDTTTDKIIMSKPSLMTLLHEFRHAFIHSMGYKFPTSAAEKDAQYWSHQVFLLALPVTYFKSLGSKKFLHDPFGVFILVRAEETSEPAIRPVLSGMEGLREATEALAQSIDREIHRSPEAHE